MKPAKHPGCGHYSNHGRQPGSDRLRYASVGCAVLALLSACDSDSGGNVTSPVDPAPSAVALTVVPLSVSEGAGSVAMTLTATLVGGSATSATVVSLSVNGDTADGDDFSPVPPFTITIPGRASFATTRFTLMPRDDNEDEDDETVSISGTASGLTVNPVAVTIVDNDEPGSGSGWVRGQFLPASTYTDQCASPRTGTDPDTGQPLYPDIQGATVDENNWLRSWSNNTYLWYAEIVDRDPGLYGDPLDYFDLLRTEALTPSGARKDRFHFTYDTEFWRALIESGASAGYGATWELISRSPPREAAVAFTDTDTPASAAGLLRGARIVSIDGIDFVNANDGTSVNRLNAALYPDSAGETHTFEFRNVGSTSTFSVELTSEITTSTPVQHVGTVTSTNGATVGYMLFNDHIRTAEAGLIDAIRTLDSVQGGIEDLVIDMRYNGGGYLYIASELAYMIAGNAQTAGRVFEELRFNDKHPETNPVTGDPLRPIPFYNTVDGQRLPALNLQRVFVLTGRGTCSASEAVINGLRGIDIEVIQIGSRTCGKPYGFYAADNCGTTYFTVQFQGVNNKGFGDYGDGFMPSQGNTGAGAQVPGCSVADDFDHALGDPAEGRLAAALEFRDSSTCPATASGLLSDNVTVVDPREALMLGDSSPEAVHKPFWLTNRILRD